MTADKNVGPYQKDGFQMCRKRPEIVARCAEKAIGMRGLVHLVFESDGRTSEFVRVFVRFSIKQSVVKAAGKVDGGLIPDLLPHANNDGYIADDLLRLLLRKA